MEIWVVGRVEMEDVSLTRALDGLPAAVQRSDGPEHDFPPYALPERAVILLRLGRSPDGDVAACRAIRARTRAPVLCLAPRTAADEAKRLAVAIDAGADDFLWTPTHPQVLRARCRALWRRHVLWSRPQADPPWQRGPLHLDMERGVATVDGERVPLTPTEFEIVATLLEAEGEVVARERFIRSIHGPGHHIDQRAIDTHIRRIRVKLRRAGFDPIETVYGAGYRIPRPT